MRAAIADRLAEGGLELHPVKTRIVYCKDDAGVAPEHTSFTFLGYEFRPRLARTRRQIHRSFNPAISKAAKGLRREIRSWRSHQRSVKSLEELADEVNPVVRGWINYYGPFGRRSCTTSSASTGTSSGGPAEIQTVPTPRAGPWQGGRLDRRPRPVRALARRRRPSRLDDGSRITRDVKSGSVRAGGCDSPRLLTPWSTV